MTTTTPVAKAEKALTKAREEHEAWQAKLQAAKADQAALVERNADVKVTPETADKVFAEHDAEEQRLLGVVEKIEAAMAKSADKITLAERDVIKANVEVEETAVEAAHAAWTKHEQKRDKLLADLKELEGADYRPQPISLKDGVSIDRAPSTATDRLRQAWISAKARVGALRYFLDSGELANVVSVNGDTVAVYKGTPRGFRGRWLMAHEKPECLYGPQPDRTGKRLTGGVNRIGLPSAEPLGIRVPVGKKPKEESRDG